MYQADSKIVLTRRISEKYFLFTLENSKIAGSSKPGQFVMIRIDSEKIFLRRPFSICNADKNTFDLLFKVVGIGTEILSDKKPGETLNVIGPLGNTYPLNDSSTHSLSSHPVFIAGGTGAASIIFFARYLAECNKFETPPVVFIGAKSKKDVLFEKEFNEFGYRTIVATEDGSAGSGGLITDIFDLYSTSRDTHPASVVYACGPRPMLKEIHRISEKKGLECFVSLEEHMACGVGTCMGCAVNTRTERPIRGKVKSENLNYKRVCKDGPIFNAREIVW